MDRIVVCLKQAVDISQLKVDPSTGQLITIGVPRKISDFDKNALEEAIKIKEKIGEVEVCTLTVSSENAKAVLREALAIGADKAYFVKDNIFQDIDTSGTAYILAKAIKKIGKFDLIICGDTSLDSFSGLVGSKLAEKLNVPQITSARAVSIENETVIGERTLENAYEMVKAKIPALITVTREINQPRIPSLMMVLRASKKEIITWTASDLDIKENELISKIEWVEVSAPKSERKKILITGETPQEISEKLVVALIKEGVIGR